MGPRNRSSAVGSRHVAENGPAFAQPNPRRREGDAESAPSVTAGAAGEAPGEAGGRLQPRCLPHPVGGERRRPGVADRVGRATVAAGGFVQSSRVQAQNGSPGEASMTLVVPSAKLQGTLAHLERIAAVRAESQSLQDITSEYHAAGVRLAAARAERAALLRALANATTAAAVESLHARLAEASREISAAERRQASVSHRASQAHVEVTVLGRSITVAAPRWAGVFTTPGRCSTVSLAVLVVAAAVLVPLGLLLGRRDRGRALVAASAPRAGTRLGLTGTPGELGDPLGHVARERGEAVAQAGIDVGLRPGKQLDRLAAAGRHARTGRDRPRAPAPGRRSGASGRPAAPRGGPGGAADS